MLVLGRVLGYGAALSVPDGNLKATQETSVVVLEAPVKKSFLGTSATPGFETVLAFVALAGAAFVLAARRNRP